jgi:hypothetical protein
MTIWPLEPGQFQVTCPAKEETPLDHDNMAARILAVSGHMPRKGGNSLGS